MIKALLLTGQGEAGVFVVNVLVGVVGLIMLMVGMSMADDRVRGRDIGLTFLFSAVISQFCVLVMLRADRAYELRYTGYNGSWIGDWWGEMIFGMTSRASSAGIAGLNALLVPWALMVLCLAVASRWGRSNQADR